MANRIEAREVEEFASLVESNDPALGDRVAGQHPARLADLLETLPASYRPQIWSAADAKMRGEVLLELHDDARDLLLAQVPADLVVDAVVRLQADEIADLDAHLSDDVFAAVMRHVTPERFRDVERVRAYADGTAGGLMDVDALSVRPDVSLAAVQRYLRSIRRARGQLPEHLDSLMVQGRDGRVVGALGLADLVSCDATENVAAVMDPQPVVLHADMPAEQVAALFADHDLASAPVVDEDQRLLGRITVDDVVDVIREAAERRGLRPAGLDEEADLFAPPLRSVKRRGGWLLLNLMNAFIAAWVIGQFEATIASMVALAVLMPVVASMGGVAGQQSLALVIRAVALEQINRANLLNLVSREVTVGLANGLAFALFVGTVAMVWFGHPTLGVVFALGMLISVVVGTVMGAIFPIGLRALGVDPALAGGVVLTATTDVLGFAVFLGLAALFII